MYRRKYKTKFHLLFKLLYLILMATPMRCNSNKHMHRQDGMGRADKDKMIHLADDLVKDAHLKMRQLFEIRSEHAQYVSFNIGVVIGKVNEKFRYMLEMYKDIYDKGRSRHDFTGPGMYVLRTVHYIIAMEMVHALEVEVDQLLHALEKTAILDMQEDNVEVGEKMDMRSGKERLDEEEAEIKKEAEEELAKSMMREQYLMKRLGLPPNTTTTKKRFMDHWPVEETWSFENNPQYK